LGKQAIMDGFSPLAVVAFRTGIAAILLLLLMAAFQRKFFYIYPLGLVGCVLAGVLNGAGSILYYTAFSRLDASVGQLLYSFYPLFLAIWLLIDRQPINRLTYLRLLLAVPGITLLILTGHKSVDLIGAGMMLGAAILYALHLLVNQRVLYEVPAQTVTFYTLLSMGATVTIPYLTFDRQLPIVGTPWWPVLGMALFTFFSRITLFLGVKHLGGIQTAMLGLGELLITVLLAVIWLGDRLTIVQWFGAVLLAGSLFMVGYEKSTVHKRYTTGLLAWLNPPHINPNDFPWES
jgi:drug/metabolite transporter (DMT)-like permease